MEVEPDIEAGAVDGPGEHNREIVRQYLESDGSAVDHPMADRLILLYTRGRRTGVLRRVPLASFQDGGSLLVVGSKGGHPRHPSWYRNVVADGDVWVRRGARVYPARAEVLDGEERRMRWDRIVAEHPVFALYQERSGRTLPLVRLTAR